MLWRCSRRPWPTKGRIVTSHNDKAKWQPWFFEKPCNFSPRCLLKQKRSGRLVLAGLNYLCFWGKNWFWLVLTIFVFFGASLTWWAPPCRCQMHRCFLFELDFFRRRPSWKDWKTQAAQPHSTRNRSSSFDSCGPVTCSTDAWFGSVSLLLFLQRNLVDAGCSGYFSHSCLSFLDFWVCRFQGQWVRARGTLCAHEGAEG